MSFKTDFNRYTFEFHKKCYIRTFFEYKKSITFVFRLILNPLNILSPCRVLVKNRIKEHLTVNAWSIFRAKIHKQVNRLAKE